MSIWGLDDAPSHIIPVTVAQDAEFLNDGRNFVGVRKVCAFPDGITFAVVIRTDDQGQLWRSFTFGRAETNAHDEFALHAVADSPAQGPVVLRATPCGGGGGEEEDAGYVGSRYEFAFWLPIPAEAKTLTLVASWAAKNITEARIGVDLEMIREAAQRAIILRPR